MADEGKFSFGEIYDYLNSGNYPNHFEKSEKRGLRKRAAFFLVKEGKLYYKSGMSAVDLVDSIICTHF